MVLYLRCFCSVLEAWSQEHLTHPLAKGWRIDLFFFALQPFPCDASIEPAIASLQGIFQPFRKGPRDRWHRFHRADSIKDVI